MNSWKIILAAVVIFGTGMITGGLLVNHASDKPPEHADLPAAAANTRPPEDYHGPVAKPEVPLPRLAERLSKEFVHRLNDSLHLTPAQREAIATIVAEGQERNHVLWTNVAPQMRKVMQDVNQQIRSELTPEQLKQFEALMKQPAKLNPGFSERLPAIKSHNTNRPAARANADFTPDPQLQRLEAERLRAATNPPQLLPPPAPTNAPGA